MTKSKTPRESKELAAVRARLETWRQRYGGRGKRIPDDLWEAAARVARLEGVAPTARALQMDSGRMAAWVEDGPKAVEDREVSAVDTFVELDIGALGGGIGPVMVELETRHGDRMRVSGLDLHGLTRLTEVLTGGRSCCS